MSVLFDTSALVAAVTAQHPEHHAARGCFIKHVQDENDQVCMSTHALAESFAVLTRIPRWRVSSEQARQIIAGIHPHVTIISLDEDDYMWALDRMTSLRLVGGAIYDLLHAR
ncbi:MAG: PIN domain-containing protein, partial [Deinococcota bacterium]